MGKHTRAPNLAAFKHVLVRWQKESYRVSKHSQTKKQG